MRPTVCPQFAHQSCCTASTTEDASSRVTAASESPVVFDVWRWWLTLDASFGEDDDDHDDEDDEVVVVVVVLVVVVVVKEEVEDEEKEKEKQ